MRANEPSGRERRRSQISNRAPVLHRVVAFSQAGHYFVLPIENDHFAQQVRDHHVAIPFMQKARHLQRARDGINMLALQRKALQAAVAAVGHDQHRRIRARVYPQAVRTIDLVVAFARSAEGANEFRFLVVLIDVA